MFQIVIKRVSEENLFCVIITTVHVRCIFYSGV